MAQISQKVERMVAILDENKTALDAAALMTERHIGSVVVTSHSKVKGLFTERDFMRHVICERRDPAEAKLKDVMRPEFVTVGLDEKVERCLELMKRHQTRHLLVFDRDEFIGVVSLRDLVMLLLEEKERLIEDLTHYITG